MSRSTILRPVRYAVFTLIAVPATILAWIVASLLVLLQPRTGRWGSVVARVWGRVILLGAGCRVRIEDLEHFDKGEVRMVVSNHTSFLDPPALFFAVPANVRFIMKVELASFPFIGWYSRLAGHFFLDRKDSRAGQEVIERATDRARRHHLFPAIFPEGTRSPDGRLQPLRAGSFKLAVEAEIPVQPLVILGPHAVMPKGSWGPRQGGTVVVRFGPPIPSVGLEGSAGRKELSQRVRQAFLDLGAPGSNEA